MRKTITWLHPFDMAIILMLLEGATFFLVGFLQGLHSVLLGLVAGSVGTVLALGAWHMLRGRIRGRFAKPFTLTHIGIVRASLANGIFLALLFIIEDRISAIQLTPLFGFLAVLLTVWILLLIYNVVPWKLTTNLGRITKVSATTIAIIAGMYEALILPLMLAHFSLGWPLLLTYGVAGIVAGFIGGMAGTVIFNYLACLLEPWVELK